MRALLRLLLENYDVRNVDEIVMPEPPPLPNVPWGGPPEVPAGGPAIPPAALVALLGGGGNVGPQS